MPAYTWKVRSQLLEGLTNIRSAYDAKTALILTPEEFIQAFIPSDVYAKLKEVEALVGKIRMGSSMVTSHYVDGNKFEVTLEFGSMPPCLVPLSATTGLADTAPKELVELITDRVRQRNEMGMVFGDAYDAIHYLENACDTIEDAKLLFPALPTLLTFGQPADSVNDKRARRLAGKTKVGNMPLLSRDVKQRLQNISAVIAGLTLLQDAPVPALENGHCRISRIQPSPTARGRCDLFNPAATAAWL